jgi:Uma2 family endonuclease
MSTIAQLTLEQYDLMIKHGVFDRGTKRRLEFIRGEIREMTPIGSLHDVVVDWLAEWSIKNFSEGQAWVRVQNSIGLPELESAPEPDVAWVKRRDYSEGRPKADDVLLIIEVAESSLTYDRGEKADLCAQAGIADYWLVNLVDASIEVRRDPETGRYSSVQTLRGSQTISPLAFPELSLTVESLLP